MPAAARYQSQAVKGGNAIKRNAAWSNELLATAAPTVRAAGVRREDTTTADINDTEGTTIAKGVQLGRR
jgi:hypothetical protein